MNDQRCRRPCAMAESGFTLLEMLIVLAIIGLAAAIAVPLLKPPTQALRLEQAARKLADALRATRGYAIGHDEVTELAIDLDRGTYESVVTAKETLASDIAVRLTFANDLHVRPASGGIRFYPSGGSSGGDIFMRLADRTEHISINWLTGSARVER